MSSPPATPPTKSRWGRMGGVVRRASTVLAISQISRPGTPASERDSDSVSIKRSTSREAIPPNVPALSPPSRPVEATLPTPIAESPAREAEAVQQETVGPSPLAQPPTAEVTRSASPETIATEPATVPDEEQTTSPTGYVPPPVVDSSVGNPGAYTDDPEALPQPDVVVDPYAAALAPEAPPANKESVPAPEALATKPADDLDDLPKPAVIADPFASTPNPVSYPAPAAAETSSEAKPIEAPALETSASYFDKPMAESLKDFEPAQNEATHGDTPKEFTEAVLDNTAILAPVAVVPAPAPEAAPEAAAAPAPQEEVNLEQGEAASYYRGDPSMPIAEPYQPGAEPVKAPPSSKHSNEKDEDAARAAAAIAIQRTWRGRQKTQGTDAPAGPAPTEVPIAAPVPTFGAAVMPIDSYGHENDLPSYSGHDIWGGAISNSTQPKSQGGHDMWATGTVAAAAAAAGAVATAAVVGGMVGGSTSRASSVRMPLPNPHPETDTDKGLYSDPFADPVVPRIAVSHSESGPAQMPTAGQEEAHGGIVMPLPAFHEVIPSSSMHRVPSHSSSYGEGNGQVNRETDERIPLLARPTTPNKGHNNVHNSRYAALAAKPQNVASNLASSSASSWNPNGHTHHAHGNGTGNGTIQPQLHELGWLEYHLPDGTVYYVHPTRRLTTDANLRKASVLTALEAWFELRSVDTDTVNVGVEAWVREGSVGKSGKKQAGKGGKKAEPVPFFERYWVDHIARTVVKEDLESERRVGGYGRGGGYTYGPSHSHGRGKKQASASGGSAGGSGLKHEEDQLDLEYRFWSFMEAHPAHTALPAKAKAEAMDVLTWSWTDRLLPSHRAIPSPFTQEECQELMTLLRSFNEHHHDDHGIQTRVVSRILLRVAHWRQTHFRPHKALPRDVGTGANNHLPVRRHPIGRVFFDFFISCLCLGIPYLFLERARHAARITDAESGLLRSASPMVIIGACTCIVAAIVLSASVTFLSLPGLDSVARTAGMVAVLFAAFTMAATGVAVLRHKADLERPVPHVGVEGLMVVSRRTIALSLPLVFLAYSIIGFVTGIILYSYRGVSTTDPSLTKNAFEDYTRWTVVGVVGALAGIVTTSMLVLRR